MIFRPYPYQRRAIDWVYEHPECCLFLDMGLGKSVITLTALRTLISEGDVKAALVVAPKKVAESTWSDETAKWEHLRGLRVSRILGNASQRLSALEAAAEVYVVSRDNFTWLMVKCSERKRMPFDALVLDELTSFKSPSARRFKAVKAVRPLFRRVIGLTGTPAPNGLADLWAQMYCIDGGERLGKAVTRFRAAYFNAVVWNNITIRLTPKKGAEEAIRRRLSDICLSMSARDYLELPPMTTVSRMVELPADVLKGYRDFEREKVLGFMDERGHGTAIAASAAALLNKLQQYANGQVYDTEKLWHPVHSEKLAALLEIVEAAGEPVLVFYQYRSDAERIARGLPKGTRCLLYDGADTLKAWNRGEIDVLLAHPASTAFGLNMQQGGRYIVWYGTGWNLEHYQQANARLHRQGQKKPVTVYRLLCRGTVDERAAQALEGKGDTQNELLKSLTEHYTR